MDIFKQNTFLSVQLIDDNYKNKLELIYRLLDIDIVDRYIRLIDENNQLKNDLRFNYRKILNKEEIELRFVKFKSNIDFINSNYDKKIPSLTTVEDLYNNQELLNDLHEEYEIYGDRLEHLVKIEYFSNPISFIEYYNPIWPGNKNENDKVLHEAFLLLNEQIHNFEAIFRNWDNPRNSLCTCLFDFVPAGIHEDLKSEDYMLFTPEKQWGWAYLGYNTLGKHWSSACHDNDIDVVKRNQIRPQKRFAAETYLNFSPTNESYHTRVKLYKWWHENNISQFIDADMKLKDLALGFIPIASLVAYKTNDKNYIYINDSIDKKEWNENVWSKYSVVDSVEIIQR